MPLDRVGVVPALALVLRFGRPPALEGLALLPPPDELVAVGLVDARQFRHRLFQERVGVVVALADRVVGVRAQHRLSLHRLAGLAYTALTRSGYSDR